MYGKINVLKDYPKLRFYLVLRETPVKICSFFISCTETFYNDESGRDKQLDFP